MEYLVVEFLGFLLCFRGRTEGPRSDWKEVDSEDVWERGSGEESEGVESLEKKKEGKEKKKNERRRAP